jgi:hypothetical protein
MSNDTQTQTGWTNPPSPPKKRKTGRIIAASVGLALGGIVIIGVVASGGSDDTTPVTKAPTAAAPHKANERADLTSFVLDDRSASSGITDVWVKYAIHNHSSKTSDYLISWEAIDKATGDRVADGEEGAYNVRPGQTTHEEDVTELNTANVTINITGFDRTEAYN